MTDADVLTNASIPAVPFLSLQVSTAAFLLFATPAVFLVSVYFQVALARVKKASDFDARETGLPGLLDDLVTRLLPAATRKIGLRLEYAIAWVIAYGVPLQSTKALFDAATKGSRYLLYWQIVWGVVLLLAVFIHLYAKAITRRGKILTGFVGGYLLLETVGSIILTLYPPLSVCDNNDLLRGRWSMYKRDSVDRYCEGNEVFRGSAVTRFLDKLRLQINLPDGMWLQLGLIRPTMNLDEADLTRFSNSRPDGASKPARVKAFSLTLRTIWSANAMQANALDAHITYSNFYGSALSGMGLHRASIDHSVFQLNAMFGLDLTESQISDTFFTANVMPGSDFSNAAIVGTTFEESVMDESNFSCSAIGMSKFDQHTSLIRTNFQNALFFKSDLSQAIGLETANLEGACVADEATRLPSNIHLPICTWTEYLTRCPRASHVLKAGPN